MSRALWIILAASSAAILAWAASSPTLFVLACLFVARWAFKLRAELRPVDLGTPILCPDNQPPRPPAAGHYVLGQPPQADRTLYVTGPAPGPDPQVRDISTTVYRCACGALTTGDPCVVCGEPIR